MAPLIYALIGCFFVSPDRESNPGIAELWGQGITSSVGEDAIKQALDYNAGEDKWF